MLDHNFATAELNRRLANIIRIGLVKEVDYEKARVRVKIGEFITDWLPWVTARAGEDRSWFSPDIDEQVMVLSPYGELSLEVVLPAIYQEKYPPSENKKEISSVKFQDGTKFTYDKDKHHLEIDVVDKITLKVEESSIEMTKKGIKLKAKRIDLNQYMDKAIVCVGDYCSGIPAHVCTSGSEDVFVNGRSVCRKGDILTLGEKLTQGSNSVFVNGIGVTRTGDLVSCGFHVMSDSKNVFAG